MSGQSPGAPLFVGAHVQIREMTIDDAQHIVSWRNRPEVAQWLYQWEPLTVEHHLQWFQTATQKEDMLFMFERTTGELVGTGSIYGFQRRLGYSGEWGRICTADGLSNPMPLMEACYLVHRLALEEAGMRRLFTEVAVGNTRSDRLVRFLGYIEEGTRRQHHEHPSGELLDVVEFGLLPNEFKARRGEIERSFYRRRPLPTLTDAGRDWAAQRRLKTD